MACDNELKTGVCGLELSVPDEEGDKPVFTGAIVDGGSATGTGECILIDLAFN
jgi:hypothetical protein